MKIQRKKPKAPKATEDFLELKAIVVPEALLNSQPNPEKTQQAINYVKQTGHKGWQQVSISLTFNSLLQSLILCEGKEPLVN